MSAAGGIVDPRVFPGAHEIERGRSARILAQAPSNVLHLAGDSARREGAPRRRRGRHTGGGRGAVSTVVCGLGGNGVAEAALPQAKIGSIGGSGTWGARFPEDLQRSEVKVLEYIDPIATPYGTSCPL